MVSSASDFCPKRKHGLDQGVEVAQLGSVIGDAHADGEAAAEDRLRRNGDPAYLEFGQDLLIQGVETLVRHAPAGVTEADRVQGYGRKQLESGLPLDAPGEAPETAAQSVGSRLIARPPRARSKSEPVFG
jgi:hypothetical protein